MNGPISFYALRLLRQNRELKAEVRRLRGHVAALHEIADELEAQRDDVREALHDLETLHGWMEAT